MSQPKEELPRRIWVRESVTVRGKLLATKCQGGWPGSPSTEYVSAEYLEHERRENRASAFEAAAAVVNKFSRSEDRFAALMNLAKAAREGN